MTLLAFTWSSNESDRSEPTGLGGRSTDVGGGLFCGGSILGGLGNSLKLGLPLLLVLVLGCRGIAVDSEQAKHSASADSTANSKRQSILEEITKLQGHEWAGDYYTGDGLSANISLAIAPKSGYVFEWHGCMGLYDRNYGLVTFTNSRIRLAFTFKNDLEGWLGIAPELIPVSWGSRHYLIAADDMVGFCNNINSGQEPRNDMHGFCLLRRGDESQPVTGLPKVPAEYQEYLLAKPIEATIIAVGSYKTRPSVVDWKFKETPVTIDAGTRQGLRVGMELSITKPGDKVEPVRITQVEEMRSEGVITQIGEGAPGPEVGWRLSTRSPWNLDWVK